MKTKLKDKESIKSIISEMTVEEKIKVLTGESMFKTPEMKEYGIPSVYFLDSAAGINVQQMGWDAFQRMKDTGRTGPDMLFGADALGDHLPRLLELFINPEKIEKEPRKSVREDAIKLKSILEKEYLKGTELPSAFPSGILLASTWNEDVIFEVGSAVGKEAQYFGVDILLGSPNVNMHRDPLNGRLYESFSEDPHLASKLAPEIVKGVQSQGIAANVKHFAANNQETNRQTVDETISLRALREIYLPVFKACVQEGKAKTIMASYNSINGEFSSFNHWLLTEVLREEWGFEGFVVCDWGGTYDNRVKSLVAGNDFDMPGPKNFDEVIEAVESGELDEEILNKSVERYLNIVLDLPAMKGKKQNKIDRDFSKNSVYNGAKEGIVLLKNANEVLPICTESNISVYGQKSKSFYESGVGSGNVITDKSTNIFSCLIEKTSNKILYEETNDSTEYVVIVAGVIGSEGFDRADLLLDFSDLEMIRRAISDAKQNDAKTILILNVAGPVDLREFIEEVDVILCVFIPGMEGARATSDIIFGDVNPSGKLPLTFPKKYRDTPTSNNFPGRDNKVWYAEDIFIGYRYYDYKDIEPMFEFGYGLSYTNFEIFNLQSKFSDFSLEDDVEFSFTLKNIGDRSGKEVVQVYIGQVNPTLVKPPKELKFFKKIELQPMEEKEIFVKIPVNSLASYDEGKLDWVVEPGQYVAFIGNSSRNISLEFPFNISGYNPYGFNENTSLGKLAATPGALEVISKYIPEDAMSKEAFELAILFRAAGTIGSFWEETLSKIYGHLNECDRQKIYTDMLIDLNQFTE